MTFHAPPRTVEPQEDAMLWPAPGAAVSLYVGDVMHQRLKPVAHRFRYKVFNILIDIDRLDEAGRVTRLFAVNRAAPVSFHEADHVDGTETGLRPYVDRLLAESGLPAPAARVLLACYPRILGRVFNPIAVYYAYDAAGFLKALIYEVRNTFGERHTYVCLVRPGEAGAAGIRQERDKRLYVSPFISMAMRYRFRMVPPGETMKWRILETDAEGPLLAATFHGKRQALDATNLCNCLLRIPFQTWKIVGGIHFEALRLWLKGARYRPRGPAPPRVSFEDEAL